MKMKLEHYVVNQNFEVAPSQLEARSSHCTARQALEETRLCHPLVVYYGTVFFLLCSTHVYVYICATSSVTCIHVHLSAHASTVGVTMVGSARLDVVEYMYV